MFGLGPRVGGSGAVPLLSNVRLGPDRLAVRRISRRFWWWPPDSGKGSFWPPMTPFQPAHRR